MSEQSIFGRERNLLTGSPGLNCRPVQIKSRLLHNRGGGLSILKSEFLIRSWLNVYWKKQTLKHFIPSPLEQTRDHLVCWLRFYGCLQILAVFSAYKKLAPTPR